MINEAFIVDAVRSPVGKRGGGLAHVHPADLGAHAIRALIERVDVDPAAVDDVVFGCVDTIGPQAGDIARTCWLVAGMPDEVPGTTVDRQCGSSQQAVHFAAQAVMSGTADLVLAGEQYGFADPFSASPGWIARYGTQEVSQFRSAEMIAEKWNLTRADMEEFAVASHERALRARAEGRFDKEIVPLDGVTFDEGPREPNLDKIRSLPTLVEGGRLTAAVASQISDASAAMLIASSDAVRASIIFRCAAPIRCGCSPRRSLPLRTRCESPACRSTTSTSSRSTKRSRRSCSHGNARPAPISSG
jgi:acetyl-CoA C-acetyltransferase